MAEVNTNDVQLTAAVETSIGVAGTDTFKIEPNDITSFGATITRTSRNPISPNRNRRKGSITDLDSDVAFTSDLTLTSARQFLPGFMFANTIRGEAQDIPFTSIATGGDFQVSALSATQAGYLKQGALVLARGEGAVDADIEGDILEVSTVASSGDTEIDTSSSAVSTEGGTLSVIGVDISSGSATYTYNSSTNVGTVAGLASGVLSDQDIEPGMLVYLGNPFVNTGNSAAQASFDDSGDTIKGYGIVKSVVDGSGANSLEIDVISSGLMGSSSGTQGTNIYLMLPEFVRNQETTSSLYLNQSYTFEACYPNLGTSGGTVYEYSIGNHCNVMNVASPLTANSTIDWAFIGQDTENNVTSRKTGFSSAIAELYTTAFSSTQDLARLRIADLDNTGLSTDFTAFSLALNNNVSANKVLGKLGARFFNVGNFNVDMTATLVFTNPAVIDRIRNNATVRLEYILNNRDGVVGLRFLAWI